MPTVAIPTYKPITIYRKKIQPEMIGWSCLLGGYYMMSTSGGLNPRAVAGNPSVTRLTHSNYTGVRPSGIPSMAVMKMLATSPMLLLMRYLMKALVLE